MSNESDSDDRADPTDLRALRRDCESTTPSSDAAYLADSLRFTNAASNASATSNESESDVSTDAPDSSTRAAAADASSVADAIDAQRCTDGPDRSTRVAAAAAAADASDALRATSAATGDAPLPPPLALRSIAPTSATADPVDPVRPTAANASSASTSASTIHASPPIPTPDSAEPVES
jgi:hypothetical protein